MRLSAAELKLDVMMMMILLWNDALSSCLSNIVHRVPAAVDAIWRTLAKFEETLKRHSCGRFALRSPTMRWWWSSAWVAYGAGGRWWRCFQATQSTVHVVEIGDCRLFDDWEERILSKMKRVSHSIEISDDANSWVSRYIERHGTTTKKKWSKGWTAHLGIVVLHVICWVTDGVRKDIRIFLD